MYIYQFVPQKRNQYSMKYPISDKELKHQAACFATPRTIEDDLLSILSFRQTFDRPYSLMMSL